MKIFLEQFIFVQPIDSVKTKKGSSARALTDWGCRPLNARTLLRSIETIISRSHCNVGYGWMCGCDETKLLAQQASAMRVKPRKSIFFGP